MLLSIIESALKRHKLILRGDFIVSFNYAEIGSGAVVINRGFWPVSDVPGESLLALAENLGIDYDTFVLTQSNTDMQAQCRDKGRAMSVQIRSCRSFTDSNSRILSRLMETFYFGIWVLIQLFRIRPRKHILYQILPQTLVEFCKILISLLLDNQQKFLLNN